MGQKIGNWASPFFVIEKTKLPLPWVKKIGNQASPFKKNFFLIPFTTWQKNRKLGQPIEKKLKKIIINIFLNIFLKTFTMGQERGNQASPFEINKFTMGQKIGNQASPFRKNLKGAKKILPLPWGRTQQQETGS